MINESGETTVIKFDEVPDRVRARHYFVDTPGLVRALGNSSFLVTKEMVGRLKEARIRFHEVVVEEQMSGEVRRQIKENLYRKNHWVPL